MGTARRGAANLLEAFGGLALLRYLTRGRPRILMYHRVTDEPFVSGLCIENFERQLRYITDHFRVVPLNLLLAEYAAGAVRPYTLALTFDDAHADFYRNIWPRLRALQLPATLFVPTGFVDGTHWLWPDRLRYVLLNAVSPEVDVPGVGKFSLAAGDVIGSWSELGDHCLQLVDEERNAFIDRLAKQLSVAVPAVAVAPFAAVDWQQLREMKAEGLDVGSHSVSHPILRQLATSDIEHELLHSARRLQAELGEFPRGICYPNGRPQDIDERVVQAAKDIGYEYGLLACSVSPRFDDAFRIGRVGTVTGFLNFKWRLAGLEHSVNLEKNFVEY